MPDPAYLSPEQLAEHLSVPLKTVYRWNHLGDGPPYVKVGKHVRYRAADVEQWIADREVSHA